MNALQVFEPDARTVYTIEMVAQMARVPRRLIVLYYKLGLVSPVRDPADRGWYFNDEAIRIVRRIEYLRSTCGVNLTGSNVPLFQLHRFELGEDITDENVCLDAQRNAFVVIR
jgi:hypothetical protein